MNSSTPPAIEVDALVKTYGEVEAVRGVSFTVARGEVFGFLGPNGAGKSTTINMLCTLARPTSGTARVSGFDVAAERDDVRRHIGLVFQDQTLDGYLTAEQNLRLHAELYGIDAGVVPARMRQMLEMVDLWDRRDQPVQTFSGGMRRRLEIARGLMHSPRVLFLDEPTIGLDPQTRSSIWRYIRALQETEGTTIFMTTHYMDEAEFCDRIAIMDRGEIVVLDTPEALKASVGADRVVLGTADDDAALAALRDRFGIEATVAEGAVTFHVASGEAFVPRLFAELGVGITSVAVSRPTLDDVFMRYTGSTIRDAETASASGSQPRDDARAVGGRPMSAAIAEVVAVRVPERSWRSEVRAVRIVWRRDLIRFATDRMRIVTWLIQPLLFLFVLGAGLQTLSAASTDGVDLTTFMFPGIICMALVFSAMFSAMSLVLDREFGFLREMMVAPVRRSSIVVGKCLGGATVAALQGVIVLALAGLVDVPYDPVLLLGLFGLQLLIAFTVTAFGVMVATSIKQIQTFTSVMQMLVMPMIFLSGALYPVSGLPTWLEVLNRLNPLTYAVDPMRRLVFDHLDISEAARRTLDPGVTWWGWRVPSLVEVGIVLALGLAMMAVAIFQFTRTE